MLRKSILETVEKNNFKYNSFAILYRTNAQSRIIEESFRKKIIYHTKFTEVFLFIKEKKLKMFLLI